MNGSYYTDGYYCFEGEESVRKRLEEYTKVAETEMKYIVSLHAVNGDIDSVDTIELSEISKTTSIKLFGFAKSDADEKILEKDVEKLRKVFKKNNIAMGLRIYRLTDDSLLEKMTDSNTMTEVFLKKGKYDELSDLSYNELIN